MEAGEQRHDEQLLDQLGHRLVEAEAGEVKFESDLQELKHEARHEEEWLRVMRDENSSSKQIQECMDDDEIYMKTWNVLLNQEDKRPVSAFIMRKRKISHEIVDGKAVIPDQLKQCDIGRSDFEEEHIIDGTVYPEGWPECPISYVPIGSICIKGKSELKWRGEYYYFRMPPTELTTKGKILCYNRDSLDSYMKDKNVNIDHFEDPFKRPMVMFDWLRTCLKRSNFTSTKVKSSVKDVGIDLINNIFIRYILDDRIEELPERMCLARDRLRHLYNIHLIEIKNLLKRALNLDQRYYHCYDELGQFNETLPIELGIDETYFFIKRRSGMIRSTLNHGIDEEELFHILQEYKYHDVSSHDNGLSPLHFAAMFGDEEVIQALLLAGADVNGKTDRHCETPLHKALQQKNLRMITILLEAGADPDDGDLYDYTPMQSIACGSFDLEIAKCLINMLLGHGADINKDFRGDGDYTALERALESGEFELAKFLIDKGADVCSGANFVFQAVSSGGDPSSIIECLVDNGAAFDEEWLDNPGYTPLISLTKPNSRVEISEDGARAMRYLMAKGADVNVAYEGMNVLHRVLNKNRVDIGLIEDILAHGHGPNRADENRYESLLLSRDIHGRTPIHIAVQKGHTAAVSYLLRKGAYPPDLRSISSIRGQEISPEIADMINKEMKRGRKEEVNEERDVRART